MVRLSSKKIYLDIGCGNTKVKMKGKVVGVDQAKVPGVDHVVELEKAKLPFKSNAFDGVFALNVLEHVRNFVPLMKEIRRVMKPRGFLEVNVPYFSHPGSAADPTHVNQFTWITFSIFDVRHPLHWEVRGTSFRVLKRELRFWRYHKWIGLQMFANRFPLIYERLFANIFPAVELHVLMEKAEESRGESKNPWTRKDEPVPNQGLFMTDAEQ